MEKLSNKNLAGFYREMVRIRRVEEKLMDVFSSGEIPGFIHACIGQEAAPVAVCTQLKDTDYMSSTHRGHGHALAKGVDLKLFMAELFGKRNGLCRGRSGSMHVADKNLGILGANGIVGAGIPIATGAAFASQYRKTSQVTVCFMGDGATNQGTFHESLNVASVRKLPIVYVCENNMWAQFTPQEMSMSISDVAKRATAYDMPGVVVSNDFLEIYKAAADAIMRAREGGGPTLLEVKCKRWYGHYVGDAQKYRPEDDLKAAREDDCILNFEKVLLKDKILKRQDIDEMEKKIQDEIAEAVEFARSSPVPEDGELMQDVYA